LEDKAFRADFIKWHDGFSEEAAREADNRVSILARVLSWGAKDGPLKSNVLDGFERAYSSDRSELIWLPEHVMLFLRWLHPKCSLPWRSRFIPASVRATFSAWDGPHTTALP
jgi:hypothetical protein